MWPHKPGRMYTGVNLSTLMYVDTSTAPNEVHCLDLTGSKPKPKPAAGKPVIHTQLKGIYDMCCMKDGDKELLILAAGDKGLYAYNMRTDQLEWSAKEKLPGMEKEMEARGSYCRRERSYVCS